MGCLRPLWFGVSRGHVEQGSSRCPAGVPVGLRQRSSAASGAIAAASGTAAPGAAPLMKLQLLTSPPHSPSSARWDTRAREELHCASGGKTGSNATFGQRETETHKEGKIKVSYPTPAKSVDTWSCLAASDLQQEQKYLC